MSVNDAPDPMLAVIEKIDADVAALWAKTPNDPFWIEFAIKQRELLAAENEVYGSID